MKKEMLTIKEIFMKTTLYLVRHGETEWNRSGRFQGCIDTKLTENGLLQAQNVGEILKGKFKYIYTSPLERASKTAEIIASISEKKFEIHEGLKEINFGLWEGLTPREMSEKFPLEYSQWRSDKYEGPLCGGDLSIRNASNRIKNTLLSMASKHYQSQIVCVAHGGIIKAALIGVFDWDMTMYHKIEIGNTSITKLEFDKELFPKLITLNDTNHL